MQDKGANKMMKKEDAKTKQAFFYPDYSLSIEAFSKEEADKILLETIKK
jgi:hypothetical protein